MWLPQWFRPGGRLSSDEVAEEVVRLIARRFPPASSSRKNRGGERPPGGCDDEWRPSPADVGISRLNGGFRSHDRRSHVRRTCMRRRRSTTSPRRSVTKAGLYHYINSKDALFFEILTLRLAR
jgi:hypothetical protein